MDEYGGKRRGVTEVVPFLVADMLRENDGNYSIGADWALLC